MHFITQLETSTVGIRALINFRKAISRTMQLLQANNQPGISPLEGSNNWEWFRPKCALINYRPVKHILNGCIVVQI